MSVETFTKCWYLITFPLYILVVNCLFRVRNNQIFKISFYKLITSLGCVDLINMTVVLLMNFIRWGWWSGKPIFLQPCPRRCANYQMYRLPYQIKADLHHHKSGARLRSYMG